MTRRLADIFLTEAKKKPGRKPRKKADVSALESFIAQVQRLKELLEAKREYDRIHRQLKQGKHGQSRVIELMREHFANAFKDVGEAYDEALDPVLRLEKIAVRMISKEMRRADDKRILSILREDATPAIQEAIARAEHLAEQDPTRIFYEDWELLDVAEAYGYRRDKQLLTEGLGDWLKKQGKKILGLVRGTVDWFKSEGTPKLSSIATELEGAEEEDVMKPQHSNTRLPYDLDDSRGMFQGY